MASNPDANNLANHKGFGSDSKAANMGSKYKPIVNNNPGPGNYDSEKANQSIKKSGSSVKVGSSTRPDHWTNK